MTAQNSGMNAPPCRGKRGTVCGGAARKVRCGSCFHVIWNQKREKVGLEQDMSEDTSMAIKAGVEALRF